MIRSLLALLVLAAGFAPPIGAVDESGDSAAGRVRLPVTIERVWYKTTKKLVSKGGDLTIGPEGIEFVTSKKTVVIPLEQVYVLSYGNFKSDVNTQWAILGIGDAGPAQLVAIRDGKKLGYGQRTERIYESIKAALEQLGVGQYDVPPGYVAYDSFAHQMTLAMPEDWDAHLESLVVEGNGHSWGTTFFSSEKIEYTMRQPGSIVEVAKDPVLQRVLSGDVPAFFLARRKTESGMSCDGFTDKARERLLESEGHGAIDALGYELVEPFTLEPATVGHCAGFRAEGRSRRPDGKEVLIELYLVASRETLYVLGRRTLDGGGEASREPFETAVSTMRFSVAR